MFLWNLNWKLVRVSWCYTLLYLIGNVNSTALYGGREGCKGLTQWPENELQRTFDQVPEHRVLTQERTRMWSSHDNLATICQLLLLLSQKSNTKWVVVQHQCYKMLVPKLSVLICRFDCCTGLFILGDNKILVSLFSYYRLWKIPIIDRWWCKFIDDDSASTQYLSPGFKGLDG